MLVVGLVKENSSLANRLQLIQNATLNDLTASTRGRTPLLQYVMTSPSPEVDVVKAILDKGVNVNQEDGEVS